MFSIKLICTFNQKKLFMKYSYNIIICFLILFVTNSCNKNVSDIDKLPAVTQSGQGTFGCLVNGEYCILSSSKPTSIKPPLDVQVYDPTSKYIRLSASCNAGLYRIDLFLDSLSKYSTYTFNVTNTGNARIFVQDNTAKFCRSGLNNSVVFNKLSGEVKINRFDWVNKILSGEFKVNSENPSCKSMVLSEGRFDVKIP